LLWPRHSFARQIIIDDDAPIDPNAPEFPGPIGEGYDSPEIPFESIDWLEGARDPDANLSAFLYMLRACEHSAADVASGADYSTFFGGSRFSDFSDHPANTGEKIGVPLRVEWCQAAGLSARCVSTAAGAYQITRPTWNDVRRPGRFGPALPDFTPASQDAAAVRLLDRAGALPAILDGRITDAIALASRLWASLPGSDSGQPHRPLSFAIAKFNEGTRIA
jgi:lysozyme